MVCVCFSSYLNLIGNESCAVMCDIWIQISGSAVRLR